jgi:hypothetical protein
MSVPSPLLLAARRRTAQIRAIDTMFLVDPEAASAYEEAQVRRARHRSEVADLEDKIRRATALAKGYAAESRSVLRKAECCEYGSPSWMKFTRIASGKDEQHYQQLERVRELQTRLEQLERQ